MRGGVYAAGYNTAEGDSMASILFKWAQWDRVVQDGRLGSRPEGWNSSFHASREEVEKRRLENETTEVGKWI